MEFAEIIKKRRSCRAFKDTPVTDEQIQMLLEAAHWAPSPHNEQPFQFVAVTDAALKSQIQKVSMAAKQTVVDNNGPGWVEKYSMNFLSNCPLMMVVLYDPDKGGLGGYFNNSHGALMATSAGIQNMILTATDIGLGSLWFTFFNPDEIKSILRVPEEIKVAGIILLGQPAMEPKAPSRKEPKVHQNTFGS